MSHTRNGERDRYWLRVLLPAITIPLFVVILAFFGNSLAGAQERLTEHDKAITRHATLLEGIDARLLRIERGVEALSNKVDKLHDAVLQWGPREEKRDR